MDNTNIQNQQETNKLDSIISLIVKSCQVFVSRWRHFLYIAALLFAFNIIYQLSSIFGSALILTAILSIPSSNYVLMGILVIVVVILLSFVGSLLMNWMWSMYIVTIRDRDKNISFIECIVSAWSKTLGLCWVNFISYFSIMGMMILTIIPIVFLQIITRNLENQNIVPPNIYFGSRLEDLNISL